MSEKILITDSFKLKQTTRELTDEGYLKAKAALTSVGVQQYDLSNLTGDMNDKGKIVGVFRPPETVFHEETINSAKLKPITKNHPNENVNSDNYYHYSVGNIGENVERIDKRRLGATIQINDKDIVESILDGKSKELSFGYSASIMPKVGKYLNDDYQYIFDGAMKINHCAIVDKGRCGETVSILDSKEESSPMSEKIIKEEVIDSVEFKEDKIEELSITDNSESEEAVDQGQDQEVVEESKEINDEDDNSIDAIKKTILDDKRFLAMLKERLMDIEKSDLNDEKDNLEDEASDKVLHDNAEAEENNEKKFNDEVNYRVGLIHKVSTFFKDEDITNLSNRDILVKSLSKYVDDVDSKSDDYLHGVLDSVLKDHEESEKCLKETFKDESLTNNTKYYSSIDIRKL